MLANDRLLQPARIFLVEDSAAFLRLTKSIITKRADLSVVGEAADGVNAQCLIERIHPDLVVLDIGLPRLSGIEVARRILSLASPPKVLFLSLESSVEVVHYVLDLGAHAYVLKVDIQKELLRAIDAILQGNNDAYISGSLRMRDNSL
jgi:two-component system response regulator EvgA